LGDPLFQIICIYPRKSRGLQWNSLGRIAPLRHEPEGDGSVGTLVLKEDVDGSANGFAAPTHAVEGKGAEVSIPIPNQPTVASAGLAIRVTEVSGGFPEDVRDEFCRNGSESRAQCLKLRIPVGGRGFVIFHQSVVARDGAGFIDRMTEADCGSAGWSHFVDRSAGGEWKAKNASWNVLSSHNFSVHVNEILAGAPVGGASPKRLKAEDVAAEPRERPDRAGTARSLEIGDF
jgi:hypothetical protein